ncbi:MAG TPA: thioredoxin domain-containing protein [Alphaproteobacteria bacterium]|nr:thioredoxin domain-containing protein [Alphaproteobacteria bacterium]
MKRRIQAVLLSAFALLSTKVFAADGSSFKPPKGSQVAIVVFEDLECPSCARTYPLVFQTASQHQVSVVLHDYPIPKHFWSYQAALWARFFDTNSEKIGNDFRGYIYQNQPSITRDNLQQFVKKFAEDHHIALPFAWDPEGKLKAKVDADYNLGQRIGVNQTPTVFVVTNASWQQLDDPAKLDETVVQMKKQAGPAHAPAPAKKAPAKTAKKTS